MSVATDGPTGPAVEIHGLTKVFVPKASTRKSKAGKTQRHGDPGSQNAPAGREIRAVDELDLTVPRGIVFGFLGPNGAGKTTTLRILTTLLPLTSGQVRVAGYDVTSQQAHVRRHIGYVGQLGGTDLDVATGRENLVLAGRLYKQSRATSQQRAAELLDIFDLTGLADRYTSTYSGGQRRRLEIALGMVNQPEVLFLDEPTTGLDPQNRANLWEQIRLLKAGGTTVFLTTHYLDEADALADDLCIIDHGKTVARGAPDELKQRLGAATLDEVFLTLTGRQLRDTTAEEAD